MYRFERKFCSNKIDELISTERYIKYFSCLSFKKPYKNRVINNIYFDDFSNSSFYENSDGLLIKNKVRLRWYDDSIDNVRFEIKSKNGDFGSKKIWKLKLNINYNQLIQLLNDYNLFINFMKKVKADKNLILILIRMRPVSFNSYHRSYYEDLNYKIRMTIDSSLIFKNWRFGISDFEHKLPGLKIFEFKYSSYDLNSINAYKSFIKKIPIRLTKFSKFAYSSYSEELVL